MEPAGTGDPADLDAHPRGHPYIVRMMRATMIEVLDSGFVEMARLKGVPEKRVIVRHAVPHALGPVAQVVAIQLAWLAGGVVVVEFLFRYPGLGQALIDAVTYRDVQVVKRSPCSSPPSTSW